MSNKFLFGADPEVFVKSKGKAVSVYETGLPGSKESPFKTSAGAVQQDGFAAEFNIDPVPSHDFERFNQNIVRTIADLRDQLNKDQNGKFNLAIQPVMDFDPEYMADQPDHVKELGCNPDFNAYTLKENPMPEGDRPFRSGAGHMHYGWGADIPTDNEDHLAICAGFVKMLDATVGLYMTFIDREPRRRILYGKAGAFRPKPYGVEYRTPSNAWISTRDRRFLMHGLSNFAILMMTQGTTVERMTSIDVEKVINEGNFNIAQLTLDSMFRNYYTGPMHNHLYLAWQKIKKQMAEDLAKAA